MRRTTPLFLLIVLACVTLAPAAVAAGDAPTDTVRTNLWAARALMRDIVAEAFAAVPADARSLLLAPRGVHEARDLMEVAACEAAAARGLEVYMAGEEAEDEGLPGVDTDYELSFRLEDALLTYPRTGRRFGLWRTWADRELEVAAVVTVRDRRSGRILMNDRIVRRYGDRVKAGDHDDLATPAYDFTRAGLGDGGLNAVLEEVVVLGALAGLVTAYFATTAD